MNSNKMSVPVVSWKPSGFHSVTPYLCISNCDEAIKFYISAFNANELFRLNMNADNPSQVNHAELQIGDSRIMVGEEMPMENGLKSPKNLGGHSPLSILLYVEDVDKAFNQAIHAGATQTSPPTDMFWGDRMGSVVDPYGHRWSLSTHIENVPVEEIQQRMKSLPPSKNGEYPLNKSSSSSYRPDGFHTVTPVLSIKNCTEAIEYYKKSVNAFEIYHLLHPTNPDITLFAEIQIGDSRVMMSEVSSSTGCETNPHKSPLELGGNCCSLYLYVENVDAAYKNAIDTGAKSRSPVMDQFWGDRFGAIEDPYGFHWAFSTHIEDLTQEQILEKAKAFTKGAGMVSCSKEKQGQHQDASCSSSCE